MIFEIVKLIIFQNFPIWKTKIWLQKLAKFWDCSSIRYFAPLGISPILTFVIMNQFRRFNFQIFISYFSVSRKFGRSPFKRLLIFKLETLTILKFCC